MNEVASAAAAITIALFKEGATGNRRDALGAYGIGGRVGAKRPHRPVGPNARLCGGCFARLAKNPECTRPILSWPREYRAASFRLGFARIGYVARTGAIH